MQIARRVAIDTLRCIEQSAMPGVSPRFTLQHVGTASRPPVTMPPTAGVVEVSLDFGPPERPYGLITLMLPARMSGVLWPTQVFASGPDHEHARSVGRVLPVPVEVSAELGRLTLSLAELRSLQEGTVLDLGAPSEVTVRVGDRLLFRGEAGERGSLRCVRILRRESDL
jgi:flagellar motor switch/type III secretory pathway protein FliN